MQDWAFWSIAVSTIHICSAIWVTGHAVLNKRDTRAAIAWSGLAWLAPIVGSLLYSLFGINRIERKGARLGLQEALIERPKLELVESDKATVQSMRSARPHFAGLTAVGGRLTGRSLQPGNKIEPLINGDETFPAMVNAIGKAEKSVSLLSYIFDKDRAGDAIVDALVDAHQRGVEVRVLVDHVGSNYSKPNMVRLLAGRGVKAASFLPTRLGRIPHFANLRNHRKILVVDGRIGFTGGTNIREAHWMAHAPKQPTQCVHFTMEGPVVAHLQEAFAVDWAFTTGEQLTTDVWFPSMRRSGDIWARGIPDGPDEDFEIHSKLLFAALATAEKRVRIVTPYFLPDLRMVEALSVCALRGVTVEVYLPSNNNIPLVDWAAAAQFALLVQHGCKIFIAPPPFNHTKLMVVDDFWALIGSTNWDPRSLRLNFEFNVECYGSDFANQLNAIIDRQSAGARQITEEELDNQSFAIRLRNGLARLASPYL